MLDDVLAYLHLKQMVSIRRVMSLADSLHVQINHVISQILAQRPNTPLPYCTISPPLSLLSP